MEKIFLNQTLDKNTTKKLLSWFLDNYSELRLGYFLDEMKSVGFHFATKAGFSLGFDDLRIPDGKERVLKQAELETFECENDFIHAKINSATRYQRLLAVWASASDSLKDEVTEYFEETDFLNPLYMMAFSGARGNISQVRQLIGMRGLMSDSSGGVIDFPIRSNFREGLSVTEYAISCYGARKGLIDTALRTADSGYLTRRLVDVAQKLVIGRTDCGTNEYFLMHDLRNEERCDPEALLVPAEDRVLGRLLGETVYFQDQPISPHQPYQPYAHPTDASWKSLENDGGSSTFENVQSGKPPVYDFLEKTKEFSKISGKPSPRWFSTSLFYVDKSCINVHKLYLPRDTFIFRESRKKRSPEGNQRFQNGTRSRHAKPESRWTNRSPGSVRNRSAALQTREASPRLQNLRFRVSESPDTCSTLVTKVTPISFNANSSGNQFFKTTRSLSFYRFSNPVLLTMVDYESRVKKKDSPKSNGEPTSTGLTSRFGADQSTGHLDNAPEKKSKGSKRQFRPKRSSISENDIWPDLFGKSTEELKKNSSGLMSTSGLALDSLHKQSGYGPGLLILTSLERIALERTDFTNNLPVNPGLPEARAIKSTTEGAHFKGRSPNFRGSAHDLGTSSDHENLQIYLLGVKNEEILPDLLEKVAEYREPNQGIPIRSALTCRPRNVEWNSGRNEDICQYCYGWNLATGRLVVMGEAVGILAAQSIGEPGTQLTMRTFHTGGVFSGEVEAKVFAPHGGFVSFSRKPPFPQFTTVLGQKAFFITEELQVKISQHEISDDSFDQNFIQKYNEQSQQKNSSEILGAPTDQLMAGPKRLNLLKTEDQKLTSILELPPYSYVFIFPGQKIERNQVCAEISKNSGIPKKAAETFTKSKPVRLEIQGQIGRPEKEVHHLENGQKKWVTRSAKSAGSSETSAIGFHDDYIWVFSGKPVSYPRITQSGDYISPEIGTLQRLNLIGCGSSNLVGSNGIISFEKKQNFSSQTSGKRNTGNPMPQFDLNNLAEPEQQKSSESPSRVWNKSGSGTLSFSEVSGIESQEVPSMSQSSLGGFTPLQRSSLISIQDSETSNFLSFLSYFQSSHKVVSKRPGRIDSESERHHYSTQVATSEEFEFEGVMAPESYLKNLQSPEQDDSRPPSPNRDQVQIPNALRLSGVRTEDIESQSVHNEATYEISQEETDSVAHEHLYKLGELWFGVKQRAPDGIGSETLSADPELASQGISDLLETERIGRTEVPARTVWELGSGLRSQFSGVSEEFGPAVVQGQKDKALDSFFNSFEFESLFYRLLFFFETLEGPVSDSFETRLVSAHELGRTADHFSRLGCDSLKPFSHLFWKDLTYCFQQKKISEKNVLFLHTTFTKLLFSGVKYFPQFLNSFSKLWLQGHTLFDTSDEKDKLGFFGIPSLPDPISHERWNYSLFDRSSLFERWNTYYWTKSIPLFWPQKAMDDLDPFLLIEHSDGQEKSPNEREYVGAESAERAVPDKTEESKAVEGFSPVTLLSVPIYHYLLSLHPDFRIRLFFQVEVIFGENFGETDFLIDVPMGLHGLRFLRDRSILAANKTQESLTKGAKVIHERDKGTVYSRPYEDPLQDPEFLASLDALQAEGKKLLELLFNANPQTEAEKIINGLEGRELDGTPKPDIETFGSESLNGSDSDPVIVSSQEGFRPTSQPRNTQRLSGDLRSRSVLSEEIEEQSWAQANSSQNDQVQRNVIWSDMEDPELEEDPQGHLDPSDFDEKPFHFHQKKGTHQKAILDWEFRKWIIGGFNPSYSPLTERVNGLISNQTDTKAGWSFTKIRDFKTYPYNFWSFAKKLHQRGWPEEMVKVYVYTDPFFEGEEPSVRIQTRPYERWLTPKKALWKTTKERMTFQDPVPQGFQLSSQVAEKATKYKFYHFKHSRSPFKKKGTVDLEEPILADFENEEEDEDLVDFPSVEENKELFLALELGESTNSFQSESQTENYVNLKEDFFGKETKNTEKIIFGTTAKGLDEEKVTAVTYGGGLWETSSDRSSFDLQWNAQSQETEREEEEQHPGEQEQSASMSRSSSVLRQITSPRFSPEILSDVLDDQELGPLRAAAWAHETSAEEKDKGEALDNTQDETETEVTNSESQILEPDEFSEEGEITLKEVEFFERKRRNRPVFGEIGEIHTRKEGNPASKPEEGAFEGFREQRRTVETPVGSLQIDHDSEPLLESASLDSFSESELLISRQHNFSRIKESQLPEYNFVQFTDLRLWNLPGNLLWVQPSKWQPPFQLGSDSGANLTSEPEQGRRTTKILPFAELSGRDRRLNWSQLPSIKKKLQNGLYDPRSFGRSLGELTVSGFPFQGMKNSQPNHEKVGLSNSDLKTFGSETVLSPLSEIGSVASNQISFDKSTQILRRTWLAKTYSLAYTLRLLHPYRTDFSRGNFELREKSLEVREGEILKSQEFLFSQTYQESRTGDIVQGLPKIEQLFEARRSSPFTFVTLHQELKKQFASFCEKFPPLHAARLSLRFIQRVLVDEIQLIYHEQGVDIHDKHIELVVRQMTRRVAIRDSGTTHFLPSSVVEIETLERYASSLKNKFHQYQKSSFTLAETGLVIEPVILGLTKTSLVTTNFLSAASFQEARRMLFVAATKSSVDFLSELKHDVLVGRYLRAGSTFHTNTRLSSLQKHPRL